MRVLEVFFSEPTTIHFIKEIGRQIGLAPTSIRPHIRELLKEGLIKMKKAKPFDGFVANRDSEKFIFYKRAYNLYALHEVSEFIASGHYPKLMVVFGSYSLGEDTEESDIDILVVSKGKEETIPDKFEKKLNRKIHLILINDINKLDRTMKKKVQNGIVLHGGF